MPLHDLWRRASPNAVAVPKERLQELQIAEAELTNVSRDLDLLGWTVLSVYGGEDQEIAPEKRIEWAKRARVTYWKDPVAGATVDLLNYFTFGRGVPKPRARDEDVQEVIDEFWDDPDNKLVLTSYTAQIALGTDLQQQSNLFVLMFDDGADGKVKLSLLDHDTVTNAVRDPDNRLRAIYFLAKEKTYEWDFENDRLKVDKAGAAITKKPVYYPVWWNDGIEKDEDRTLPKPPAGRLGKGKVYHVAVNRTSEQIFGVPKIQRTARWFTALNDLLKAQVDKAQAVAAFAMKRKVKGTPSQLTKLATQAIRPSSDIATQALGPVEQNTGVFVPPRAGSILNENEGVSHESLKLDSGAGNAAQDAEIIRAQISAASGFPQHYLGAGDTANLATATAMELPVLKLVEATQELFEGVFRWAIDRQIERAVETGRISKTAPKKKGTKLQSTSSQNGNGSASDAEIAQALRQIVEANGEHGGLPEWVVREVHRLIEAHEGKGKDEKSTDRDLGYVFSMPSPMRRVMLDVVNAWALWVKTVDPNNTNLELTRFSTEAVFGDAFEVEDPSDAVGRIFPEGYVDPAVQAAQMAAGGGNAFGPESSGQPVPQATEPSNGYDASVGGFGYEYPYSKGASDTGVPGQGGGDPNAYQSGPTGDGNPYSARGFSQVQQALTRGRDGRPVLWPVEISEARFRALPEHVRAQLVGHMAETERLYADEVNAVTQYELQKLLHYADEHAGAPATIGEAT